MLNGARHATRGGRHRRCTSREMDQESRDSLGGAVVRILSDTPRTVRAIVIISVVQRQLLVHAATYLVHLIMSR
jgi:hypothetical protein